MLVLIEEDPDFYYNDPFIQGACARERARGPQRRLALADAERAGRPSEHEDAVAA